MNPNKITDESNDKKYFVMTPQIVWAVSRDPYDFTLWNTIKIITGERGECYLSTEDLATLAMMSAGKVSDCRKYLISQGVLEGEVRQDPGYPQPVWHLTIPDLWKANVEWREQYDSLKARIELKKEQRKQLKSNRVARKQAKHNSLHLVKPSPGEERPSPDEERPSPDETKKNQQEPKVKPNMPNGKNGLTEHERDELLIFGLYGQNRKQYADDSIEAEIDNSGWHIRSPLVYQALVDFLSACREAGVSLSVPNSDSRRKDWYKSLSDQIDDFGIEDLGERYRVVLAQAEKDKWLNRVGRPGSLDKTMATVELTNGQTIVAEY